MADWTGYCEYGNDDLDPPGCREYGDSGSRVKVNNWNNARCPKCGNQHPRRLHDAEYAKQFCGHAVRNQGDETDSLCNAKAVGIYSEVKPRCRLHYYMDCCDEAQERIDELEKELDELEQDLEEAEKKN